MNQTPVPTFAILGHPNEGKSSVVSTLAEDDSVRISPVPGETRQCRAYPVTVDGREIIRFVDTPGFQQPRRTLDWMTAYAGPDLQMPADFIAEHRHDPDFSDECELFEPLADGAGIIFVVDGTRPVRRIDRMEMEILRLTGRPRMAVINTKEKNRPEFLETWKSEARKNFNTIRIFDAHRATYAERIDLLESLKNIDPDWQPQLETVISSFKQDWQQRLAETAAIVLDLLSDAARHTVQKNMADESGIASATLYLQTKYKNNVHRMERSAHQSIRKQFKHNIFNYELPPQSIVHADLFSKKSRRVLGLKEWQVAAAGAATGSALGAKIDLIAAGLSFGIFTAIGGLIGGGSAALGAKKAFHSKVKGLPLGQVKLTVGPMRTDQMLFILLDRSLIYFSHVINWAHSRRDSADAAISGANAHKTGVSAGWGQARKKQFSRFFSAVRKGDPAGTDAEKPRTLDNLTEILGQISVLKKPLE